MCSLKYVGLGNVRYMYVVGKGDVVGDATAGSYSSRNLSSFNKGTLIRMIKSGRGQGSPHHIKQREHCAPYL